MLPDVTTVNLDDLLTTSTTSTNTTTLTDGTIDYQFDFDLGDFVVRDGSLIQIQDIEKVKMFINKVVRTEKFKYKIYAHTTDTDEYGVVLDELIGQVLPTTILESNIKETITKALLKNSSIVSLSDWDIQKTNSNIAISFTVNLASGISYGEEVTI